MTLRKENQSVSRVKSRQVPHQEIVTPVSARAVFWRPRYLRMSGFLHHLPFLFWLVDMQRPAIAVSLGVGDGAGYFGLCQALEKLGEGARCHGIDARPAGAGGPDGEVLAYHEAHYGDFSRLSQEDPRDLVHRFDDGAIDLLVIDTEPDASLIQSLTHDWIRKLSDRAVILVHGTETRLSNGSVQGALHGMIEGRPSIRFEFAEGLLAVLYGENRLDRLQRLADLSIGAPGYAEVHHVFARLGAANHHECLARSEAARAETALQQAEAAEQALSALRLTLGQHERALERQGQSEEASAAQLAALQARLYELQGAHDARAEAMASHSKALAEVEAQAIREAATRDAALIRERDRAESLNTRMIQAEAAAKAARSEAEAARAEAIRAAETAAAQLAVKERALSLATERLDAARAAEAKAREQVDSIERQLAEQKASAPHAPARATAVAVMPASAASEEQHLEEIRSLTLRLEATQQEVLTLQRELRIRGDQAKRLEQMEVDLKDAHQRIHDLLGSTSWRITGPLRRVVRLMRPGR